MSGAHLPEPRLTLVYHLEATLGEPLDLGETPPGHRRIVPLTGGTFTGPELRGKLLQGASADWQTVLPDGTALGDIRYTLQTDAGELLYVQSRGVRHGRAEVLARLGRGEGVDAGEYTFRTSASIEAAAPQLDWLNKGDLHQRRRPPGRRRDLRHLPGRMTPPAPGYRQPKRSTRSSICVSSTSTSIPQGSHSVPGTARILRRRALSRDLLPLHLAPTR